MNNELSKLIDEYHSRIEGNVRDYIGASSIGSDCLRQIWYQYKGVKPEGVPSKTRKTWSIGSKLEELIIQWLILSGIKALKFGVTYSEESLPIFKGTVDGLVFINDKNSILEIKTAKNSSFNIFIKKGVELWNPQYYAQVQSYMGMSGIHSAYILVLNKDNSDICDELVTFDFDYYKKLIIKAKMIEDAVIEPPRINGSPLFYKCKMCQFNKVCHA